MPSVKVRDNEPFDVALRRFKRSCEKAGILSEVRRREYYEKPTAVRKRKAAAAVKRHLKKSVGTLLDKQSDEGYWCAELEGDSINAAMRRGLTRESISVGDRVRIAGNPSNRDRREMLVTHILLPSGEEHLVHDRPRPFRWTNETADALPVDTSQGRSIFRRRSSLG